MVFHHRMSQTVKIKVNRYTDIYLLMNLFTINQFIFIFPVFQLFFHSIIPTTTKTFLKSFCIFVIVYCWRHFMMQSHYI